MANKQDQCDHIIYLLFSYIFDIYLLFTILFIYLLKLYLFIYYLFI